MRGSSRRPLAVVGAGPVGTVLAAALISTGERVVVVESDPMRRRHLAEEGLQVAGRPSLPAGEVVGSVADLARLEPRAVCLCTKTYSLPAILPPLRRALPRDAMVVCLQNGVGPEAEAARVFSARRVARGVLNFAAGLSRGTGQVTLRWQEGPNLLGPAHHAGLPGLAELATRLQQAGLPTRVTGRDQVRREVFYKTILSAGLGPLCAVRGITMGEAMALSVTRETARQVLREGLAVAEAVGHAFGPDALDRAMAYLDQGGDHLPSMAIDLARGRPTEIEAINGRIVALGLAQGQVDVGTNRRLTAEVVAREVQAGARRPDRVPAYLR